MRISLIMLAALPALGLAAFAQAPKLRPAGDTPILWSDEKGDDVRFVPCSGGSPDNVLCKEISIRQAGREIKRTDKFFLANGLHIEWRRPPGAKGPDVVVSGSGGGSIGDLDIFSIAFGAPASIQEFKIFHAYPVNFRIIDGSPRFDLTLSIEQFALESNAETAAARAPMRWTGAKFDTDFAAMASQGPSMEELDAMRRELLREPHSLRDHLAKTVQVMLEMILSGEAKEAKRTLDADWRGDLALRDRVWGRLCAFLVTNDLWRELGLDRLKGAEIVKAAAARYPKTKIGPLMDGDEGG